MRTSSLSQTWSDLVLLALAVPPKHGHGAIRGGNLTPGGKHERHHKQVGGGPKKSLLGVLLETRVIFRMQLKNHCWGGAVGDLPVHRHGAQGLGQLSRDWVSGQLWRTPRPKFVFFFDLFYCPLIFGWHALKMNNQTSIKSHVQKSKKSKNERTNTGLPCKPKFGKIKNIQWEDPGKKIFKISLYLFVRDLLVAVSWSLLDLNLSAIMYFSIALSFWLHVYYWPGDQY